MNELKGITDIKIGDFVIFRKKCPVWDTEIFGFTIKKIAITGLFLHIIKKMEKK